MIHNVPRTRPCSASRCWAGLLRLERAAGASAPWRRTRAGRRSRIGRNNRSVLANVGANLNRSGGATIAALLSEKNHAEAARVAGIDFSTLKRWMRMPGFIEAWRRARWDGWSKRMPAPSRIAAPAFRCF
jgi:hypothetical protein